MSINVLHLIDTEKACGPGRTVLESARSLKNTEFNLTIAAYNYSKNGKNAFLDKVAAEGFKQVLVEQQNQYDLTAIGKIIRNIKEMKIHIIHTHGYKSDIYGLIAGKFCGIKVVSTIHGWILNNARSKYYVEANKFCLKFFDRIITVSDNTKQILLKLKISPEKIITVHNAINMHNYSSEIETKVLREEFNIPEKDITIGTIGRLSQEKGQKDFLMAGKIILEEFHNCYFFVVGEGNDHHNLVRHAKKLGIDGRVVFTGHRSDILDVFKSLDIIVIPSYTEGLPNVALEAMAMFRPVVATKVGGIPEIITHNETGLLVNSMSPDEIADSVKYILKNPYEKERITNNARTLIEEKFTFEKRMEKIKNIYHELF